MTGGLTVNFIWTPALMMLWRLTMNVKPSKLIIIFLGERQTNMKRLTTGKIVSLNGIAMPLGVLVSGFTNVTF